MPLSLLILAACGAVQPAAATEVRVAIVAHGDFQTEADRFEQLFAKISGRHPEIRFQLAFGSYGEVLHWLERRLVDAAILTPGVFARLLPGDDGQAESNRCRYLASLQLPPARAEWATGDRRAPGLHDTYRAVCLVPETSTLRTVADLRSASAEGRIEFLFVHPLSVSGRAAPEQALRSTGIETSAARIRFSYSHSESIRMLHEDSDGKERVAFVWDDAVGDDPELETGVRRLPFPELEALRIPHDVLVARVDFEFADELQDLLLTDVGPEQTYQFNRINDWREQFDVMRRWLDGIDADAWTAEGESASLDEIGRMLLQYARSHDDPPRLALVLSGGGAKCSYQVGAVAELEDELAELRRGHPEEGLDIALVIGTSGGAINSLPVALRISGTPAGQQAFRDTWCELDQRDIVRPSLLVRANLGLWIALLQTALVIRLVRWRVRDPAKRGRAFATTYTVLAAIEILIGYLPVSPWRLLGTNHILHHAWLWLSLGIRFSAWSLFTIGLGALALERARAKRGRHITIPGWLTRGTLLAGLLGLPLVQIVTILAYEETLSGGEGMEQSLADRFPRLIDRHLADQDLPPLDLAGDATARNRLRDASRQIIERGLIKRDLVITGSCLEQTSQDLPSDLYFYAPADPDGTLPAYGDRGVSLLDRPDDLLDIVIGSGSIFPVFPGRKIDGIPHEGDRIELVDGGFAHNSPVEAAVLWGATHIVVVEATPRKRSQRGNFVRNAASSFKHLHQQAQLLDARSHGKVVVFTLAPEPPHMCVLDFSDNLIDASIARGRRDAGISAAIGVPRFQRELGEPVFTAVMPETRKPEP
jgi:predicted acylesterase/phospholipase RssA